MIYNLQKEISRDILENGVYESLSSPLENEDFTEYSKRICKEVDDCPYLYCPDYNLLVPISEELICNDDSVYGELANLIYERWNYENRF